MRPIDTVIIAWIITGNVPTALKIGTIEAASKTLLFYMHERLWAGIQSRGKEKDSHSRSLLKGISWRITGTVDTMLISWIITNHISNAVKIGGVEVVTKLSLYYLHERLWSRISWGKQHLKSKHNQKAWGLRSLWRGGLLND